MDKPRSRGYVWTSWVTKVLAGEQKCLYATWFKVNHKYDKVPETQDREEFFREWTARHDAITNKRADELKAEGWTVKLEEAGEFKLEGARADLAGKPDIVALRPDVKEALVVDAKSGKRRKSDHWQVLVYIFGLSRSWLSGWTIRGEVEYHDGREPVRPFGPVETARLTEVMKAVTGPTAPEAKPGASECRYCDIQSCAFRHKVSVGNANDIF